MSYKSKIAVHDQQSQFAYEEYHSKQKLMNGTFKNKSKITIFPGSPLRFQEHKLEAKRIYNWLSQNGFDAIPTTSDTALLAWVKFLQTNLRYYLLIPIGSRCLERADYFYGNLVEGPDFATWLKKARHYTMQYNIALDNTSIPDEYVLDGYVGYDSFFPESALIHWEEDIDDFPWSLHPINVKIDRATERLHFKELLTSEGPKKLALEGRTNYLRFIKASKMYDPLTEKSRLVRDIATDLPPMTEGWIGKRTKIQAFPGGGRDGTMATPSTLQKIKLSNEIFYGICESLNNSAMCDDVTQANRIDRVRTKSKVFLHWDFKKVGLMTNRTFFMGLSDAVQDVYGISMSWFDFENLYVIDGKDVYLTPRGYALGWMNEAITIVIIRWIREFLVKNNLQKSTDFVVFNDDVEIGFNFLPSVDEMELFKMSLIKFFSEKDVPCSIRKIFFSYESIFLEDYYAPLSDFNFEKRSVATRMYAKAANCSLPFMRKDYTNAAMKIWYCNQIVREIISLTPQEFPIPLSDERELPYESGGWITRYSNSLNRSMEDDLRSAMISRHLNDMSTIKMETQPYGGALSKNALIQKELQIIRKARIPSADVAVSKDEVDENFRFDLATDISLYKLKVPENSRFQGLLRDDPTQLGRPGPEGVG
jgi:hypothetical protein